MLRAFDKNGIKNAPLKTMCEYVNEGHAKHLWQARAPCRIKHRRGGHVINPISLPTGWGRRRA
jgi:hypothetical protein